MVSINVPLLLAIIMGELTTYVRLKVFIIVSSLAVLFVRKFICRSPQIRRFIQTYQ